MLISAKALKRGSRNLRSRSPENPSTVGSPVKLRSAFEMGLRKFSILRHTLMEKSNLEGWGLWVTTMNVNQKGNGEAEKEKGKNVYHKRSKD